MWLRSKVNICGVHLWQVLAMEWLRAAAAAGKVKAGCVAAAVRAAVLGAADKAAEVREGGVALAKQLLEVRAKLKSFQPGPV